MWPGLTVTKRRSDQMLTCPRGHADGALPDQPSRAGTRSWEQERDRPSRAVSTAATEEGSGGWKVVGQ